MKLEISLAHNSAGEVEARNQLESVLANYDLARWIFTRKIIIDESVEIPHSHPVLTLNTQYSKDPHRLMSVFIHEELHWLEERDRDKRDKAIRDLEVIFPDAPTSPPNGARDKKSTYLHLIVCYLEYSSMRELVGADRSKEIMASWPYYPWIYATVLKEGTKIEPILARHGLAY
jgi:hypothetical protein